MARLLQCHDCMTLEKLPDYEGDPDNDGVLIYALRSHRNGDGVEHLGQLFVGIPDAALENMKAREEIERAVWGARAEVASYKDTLVEDAGRCFNRHDRPKLGCIDYKDDSKRVGNYARGHNPNDNAVYLCQFCPVHSMVTSRVMEHKVWLDGPGKGRRLARN